jgi:hypothetical protein
MSAPRPLSPQDALLSLLQTEDSARVVLEKYDAPVRFEDLPQIAHTAGLAEAETALEWLTGEPFVGAEEAAILIMERIAWLDELKSLPNASRPFPADLITALTIDVPAAGRCFVVPKVGRPSSDALMLYSLPPAGDASMLLPIAVTKGSRHAQPLPQPCNPAVPPGRGCISSGCMGTCEPDTFWEGDFLVNLGCICT